MSIKAKFEVQAFSRVSAAIAYLREEFERAGEHDAKLYAATNPTFTATIKTGMGRYAPLGKRLVTLEARISRGKVCVSEKKAAKESTGVYTAELGSWSTGKPVPVQAKMSRKAAK